MSIDIPTTRMVNNWLFLGIGIYPYANRLSVLYAMEHMATGKRSKRIKLHLRIKTLNSYLQESSPKEDKGAKQ